MCIGIPMRVTEIEEMFAWCEGRGVRKRVNTMLVEGVRQGDWLLIFLDCAREIIDAERAAMINSALDALERAAEGRDDFDDCFADLIGKALQPPFTEQPDANRKGGA